MFQLIILIGDCRCFQNVFIVLIPKIHFERFQIWGGKKDETLNDVLVKKKKKKLLGVHEIWHTRKREATQPVSHNRTTLTTVSCSMYPNIYIYLYIYTHPQNILYLVFGVNGLSNTQKIYVRHSLLN